MVITLANFNSSGKVPLSKEELIRYVSGLIYVFPSSTAVLQRFNCFTNFIFTNIWDEHTFHCVINIIQSINMTLNLLSNK